MNLKGKFLDDLHNNAFNGTNGKDAVEHIEYYLKIIDPIKLPNVDHDKLRVVVLPTSLAGGGDEIEVSDNISSDLEEYRSDKEETAEIFKIETDGLKPMKITKTIGSMNGTKIYHGLMRNHGLKVELGQYRNQSNILKLTPLQDLEWYESLEDSELKDKALMNKAIMEGLISDDESCNDCWKRWKSHEIYYHNYDKWEYENKTHEEGHELCNIKTREEILADDGRRVYGLRARCEKLKKKSNLKNSLVTKTLEAKNIDEYWWRIYKSGDLEVLES
ncbi:hypothetical protein Tco_1571494 [Tanacetum coccineum]